MMDGDIRQNSYDDGTTDTWQVSSASAISTSTRPATPAAHGVCVWCWNWTARLSSAAIRISVCCTVALKADESRTYLQNLPYFDRLTMWRR